MVAKKIIEFAQRGVRDPDTLRDMARDSGALCDRRERWLRANGFGKSCHRLCPPICR
jgi:hypothetical protein